MKYIAGGIINPMNGQTVEALVECLQKGFKLEEVSDKSLGIVCKTTSNTTPTVDEDGFVSAQVGYGYTAFLNHTKKATNAKLLKSVKDLSFKLQIHTIGEDGSPVVRWLIPA